jgi:hypothetical protein
MMVRRGNRCSVVLAVVVARALAFLPFTTRGEMVVRANSQARALIRLRLAQHVNKAFHELGIY